MRNAFINTLYELAKQDNDIFLVTGDLGFGVLTKFWEDMPDQFINAGISEQNMTSVAAGLALEGKKVFTYSIANFPTLRCIEQIRNDVAYHRANVTIVSVGAGFAYGSLGMTHHATEDIAILRALPELTVFTPCDPYETIQVTKLAAKIEGPKYIRLGKGGERVLHLSQPVIEPGKSQCLKEGNEIAIFVAGAIANEALLAAEELNKFNISCAVYSFSSVKPIDAELIIKLAKQMPYIFTLEEHNIMGGFGSAVAEVAVAEDINAKIIRLGLDDTYSSIVGSQSYLRDYYGLSSQKIVNKIRKFINSN